MMNDGAAPDLDPLDVLVDRTVPDPDPEEVTDPEDVNWVEPAAGIPSRKVRA